jgi:hypothetical protein
MGMSHDHSVIHATTQYAQNGSTNVFIAVCDLFISATMPRNESGAGDDLIQSFTGPGDVAFADHTVTLSAARWAAYSSGGPHLRFMQWNSAPQGFTGETHYDLYDCWVEHFYS